MAHCPWGSGLPGATSPAGVEGSDRRYEVAVDGSNEASREVAMSFLSPDVRSWVGLDQLQRCLDGRGGVVSVLGLGGVDLDAAEVLGADEPVLAGAHQP